jgi:hypothetical protein
VKRLAKGVGAPLLRRIDARIDNRLRGATPPEAPSPSRPVDDLPLMLSLAARALAAGGQHHAPLPTEAVRRVSRVGDLKVGFFGNIANNAHNFVRCLRRLGYDATLVIQDGWFDKFVMNRPFWEDLDVECDSYDDALAFEGRWRQPHWVRRVEYDVDLQVRFQNRWSAIEEVQAMYQQAFGIALPIDRALLLAQHMGHWPYLLAMAPFDVVQFSGAPISLAPFCPRPTVVFPTGSDLWISPFEESLFGLLMRAGYRGAAHVLVCQLAYAGHLDRLQRGSWSAAPMMIDTERYAPGVADKLRQQWASTSGGTRFLLSACRHSWQWKGNDRLLRGFAGFVRNGGAHWRLILQSWGPDVARSRALIEELGIDSSVIWERLASKPVLRAKQQAADAVADQFVMPGGYGTTVLESMAAARPVMLMPPPEEDLALLPSAPPFVGASDAAGIAQALHQLDDDSYRTTAGVAHECWLRQVHGYRNVADRYLAGYAFAAGLQGVPERWSSRT